MSRRWLVASRSRGKQREFAALLAPFGIEAVTPDQLGIATSAAEAALECHETFEDNARAKAHWFAERCDLPVLADDSGLEVDALDGAPGVRSKRFAGHDGPDEVVSAANNALLLRRLHGVPEAERGARYRCVLVLSRRSATGFDDVVSSGCCQGRILDAPSGTGGFGYDPLFLSYDLGQSFGDAGDAAKAAVSHRGRAVEELMRKWPPAKL